MYSYTPPSDFERGVYFLSIFPKITKLREELGWTYE